jgi:hypothetical protein
MATRQGRIIEIRRIGDGDRSEFEVMVHDARGETRHHVTMDRTTCERLTVGQFSAEQCLEASFQFLLDREPKESILKRFDITLISRYFPEFEQELPHYLSKAK